MEISSPSSDTEPDPSFVVLDESDDEETIALEEALEPEIDPQEELRILANDLNVSLEELTAQSGSHRSRRNRKKVDYQAMLLQEQIRNQKQSVVLGQPKSLSEMCSKLLHDMKVYQEAGHSSNDSSVNTSISELTKFYLINSLSNNEDEEADVDYKPMLKPTFTREIRTGPSYQAEVPEESDTKNENSEADAQYNDQLLWKPPPVLSEEEIDSYLRDVSRIIQQVNPTVPMSNRDNEQALEILLQCNFNKEVALDIFKQKLQQFFNGKSSLEKLNSSEVNENEAYSKRENIENEAISEFSLPPKVDFFSKIGGTSAEDAIRRSKTSDNNEVAVTYSWERQKGISP